VQHYGQHRDQQQRVTYLSQVCQCSVTHMPMSWFQWSVVMLITSRLSGASYEWSTVCRHSVER